MKVGLRDEEGGSIKPYFDYNDPARPTRSIRKKFDGCLKVEQIKLIRTLFHPCDLLEARDIVDQWNYKTCRHQHSKN